MAFSLNVITTAGAALLARATSTNRLQISGCDVSSDIFDESQAKALGLFVPSEWASTVVRSFVNSAGKIEAEVRFDGGENDVARHSAILFGKLASDSDYTAIAVCSDENIFSIPSVQSVVNDFALRFTIDYVVSSNVVAVTDSALSVSQAQFEQLRQQTIGVGNQNSDGIGYIGKKEGIPVYDDFISAQCFAREGESFRVKGGNPHALLTYKIPFQIAGDTRVIRGVADVKDNLILMYFIVNYNASFQTQYDWYNRIFIAVYDLSKSTKIDALNSLTYADIFDLGEPIVYSEVCPGNDGLKYWHIIDIEVPHFVDISGCLFVMYSFIKKQGSPVTSYIFKNPSYSQGDSNAVISKSPTGFMSVFTQQCENVSFNMGWWYPWRYSDGIEIDDVRLIFLCENFVMNSIGYIVGDGTNTSQYGSIRRLHVGIRVGIEGAAIVAGDEWQGIGEGTFLTPAMSSSNYQWPDDTTIYTSKAAANGESAQNYISAITRTVLNDGTRLVFMDVLCKSGECQFPVMAAFASDLFTEENYDRQASELWFKTFLSYSDTNSLVYPGGSNTNNVSFAEIHSDTESHEWYGVKAMIYVATPTGFWMRRSLYSGLERFYSSLNDLLFGEVPGFFSDLGFNGQTEGVMVGTAPSCSQIYATSFTPGRQMVKLNINGRYYISTVDCNPELMSFGINSTSTGYILGNSILIAAPMRGDFYEGIPVPNGSVGYLDFLFIPPIQRPCTNWDKESRINIIENEQIFQKKLGKI